MDDASAPAPVPRIFSKAFVIGTVMGLLTLMAMFGVENLGDADNVSRIMTILQVACAIVSVLGLPGLIVSFLATPIIGNMHDPNIYLAAVANAIFYGTAFHWVCAIRKRNKPE